MNLLKLVLQNFEDLIRETVKLEHMNWSNIFYCCDCIKPSFHLVVNISK